MQTSKLQSLQRDASQGSLRAQAELAKMGVEAPCEEPGPSGTSRLDLSPEIVMALAALDDRLVVVLSRGDIRLVRSSWLLAQPPGFRVPHRQALERSGVSPSPLLSSKEAEELLRRGKRGVGVLSHAWLSPGNPDPMGKRMEITKGARAATRHRGLLHRLRIALSAPAQRRHAHGL